MDLLENQKINSNKDCSHLDPLKIALDEKYLELVNRKCIIFHQDNARPHVSLMTRQKLLQLGWEVLIHPPYSSDIETVYVHLFWSLQNSLCGKKFNFQEDHKNHLDWLFAQKDKKFWEQRIMKLPEKWQKAVEQNFNKVLGENEKFVFYFYFKLKELLGKPNRTFLSP